MYHNEQNWFLWYNLIVEAPQIGLCFSLFSAQQWTCDSIWICAPKKSSIDNTDAIESCWALRNCCTWRNLPPSLAVLKRYRIFIDCFLQWSWMLIFEIRAILVYCDDVLCHCYCSCEQEGCGWMTNSTVHVWCRCHLTVMQIATPNKIQQKD